MAESIDDLGITNKFPKTAIDRNMRVLYADLTREQCVRMNEDLITFLEDLPTEDRQNVFDLMCSLEWSSAIGIEAERITLSQYREAIKLAWERVADMERYEHTNLAHEAELADLFEKFNAISARLVRVNPKGV